MALSPEGMREAVVRNLKSRTRKDLEQWIRVARRSRLTDPNLKPTRRLEATKAFSDNATHSVALTDAGDMDGQLRRWLKAAYDARGQETGLSGSQSGRRPPDPARSR